MGTYFLFSVVYFSRGTLPEKAGGPRRKKCPAIAAQLPARASFPRLGVTHGSNPM